jgi:hypothetical protein
MKSKRMSTNFKTKPRKLFFKKRAINEIKKAVQDVKEGLNKYMENPPQKKKSNRKPRNKKFLKSNKNIQLKPLQETGTSGRQNFRAQRQNRD